MQREQVSEKFHVHLGHGLFRNLSVARCLAVPEWKDEDFGKSAPFYFCLIMKKIFTLFLFSMITFNAIHAEITWTLSENGTLTISGTDMPDYIDNEAPWSSNKYSIMEVVINDGVTNIGYRAFYDCPYLRSVNISNSVTSIGDYAFAKSGVRSITIPNSVTSIGNYAFYGSDLASVIIPESVTSWGKYAFSNCNDLTSVTISEGVTSIGNGAFYGCYNLTSITIPNSVTSIGHGAFSYTGLKSVTIPESVTSIGDGAFRECSGLTSVTIPNSVTSLGKETFYLCYSLTTVNIPNSVTSIEKGVFMECSKLTSINIPNSITSIGAQAFDSSGLTSVTIPESVTYLGYCAFGNISRLSSVTCLAINPPTNEGAFMNTDDNLLILVPANSVEAYQGGNWGYFIFALPPTSTLTDGEQYTNNSQLEGYNISYTRTFNNTKWQALYIPFSLSYDDWKDDFDVAYINGIRQIDTNDDNVIDETIMDVYRIEEGSLIPNTPYLIRAKTTGEKTISVSNATLYEAKENSIDCSTTISKYTFTGTYETILASTLIENEYYAMGGGSVIMTDGESDLKPYRWYLKIEARDPIYNVANTPNAAKAITINVIDEESEATGISQVSQNDKLTSRIYDLNGRVVNENALKPGIYIKNGKKFVIK